MAEAVALAMVLVAPVEHSGRHTPSRSGRRDGMLVPQHSVVCMDQGTIPDSRLAAAMEEAARPSLSVPVPRCFNPGPLLELVECGPQTWQPGCEGEALRYLADLLDVIAAPEARRAYSS